MRVKGSEVVWREQGEGGTRATGATHLSAFRRFNSVKLARRWRDKRPLTHGGGQLRNIVMSFQVLGLVSIFCSDR